MCIYTFTSKRNRYTNKAHTVVEVLSLLLLCSQGEGGGTDSSSNDATKGEHSSMPGSTPAAHSTTQPHKQSTSEAETPPETPLLDALKERAEKPIEKTENLLQRPENAKDTQTSVPAHTSRSSDSTPPQTKAKSRIPTPSVGVAKPGSGSAVGTPVKGGVAKPSPLETTTPTKRKPPEDTGGETPTMAPAMTSSSQQGGLFSRFRKKVSC